MTANGRRIDGRTDPVRRDFSNLLLCAVTLRATCTSEEETEKKTNGTAMFTRQILRFNNVQLAVSSSS